MIEKMCLRQLKRPVSKIAEDSGDCTKCAPDKENEKCPYYVPVSVLIEDIEEKL